MLIILVWLIHTSWFLLFILDESVMIFSITKFNNLKQYVQFNIIFSNFKLQNILTLVDQHHLDNRVQRNVHLVRAHAIHATMRRAIVSVAELFR